MFVVVLVERGKAVNVSFLNDGTIAKLDTDANNLYVDPL